jgi:hypothetical protein
VIPTTTTFTKTTRPYGIEKVKGYFQVNSQTFESKTYSFGPKEFKADLDSSLKREKARRIVHSKYINDQINRPIETRPLYEQRVTPNYQKKTVSYGPPPETSFRSSNVGSFGDNFKKNEYDTFENVVSQHAKPVRKSNQMDIIGKKISKKKKTEEVKTKGKNDPNTIEFSNKNGPETFTITHKT